MIFLLDLHYCTIDFTNKANSFTSMILIPFLHVWEILCNFLVIKCLE